MSINKSKFKKYEVAEPRLSMAMENYLLSIFHLQELGTKPSLSRLAEQIKLSDDITYQGSLYEPSLRYFIYNSVNHKEGNYQRGLRAYIDWKNNLD